MAKQQRRKTEPTNPAETAAPQSTGDTTAASLDRDRVAQRAYELYLARGCQEGQDLDDWLCAERELTGGERNEQERGQGSPAERGQGSSGEGGQGTQGEQRESAGGARERELQTALDES